MEVSAHGVPTVTPWPQVTHTGAAMRRKISDVWERAGHSHSHTKAPIWWPQ